MNKRKFYKILFEITPLIFVFVGSILLTFSLRLINPSAGKGAIEFFDQPLVIPQQNDGLFKFGMTLFITGSVLEIIKVITRNFETPVKSFLNYINYEKFKKFIKSIISKII